MRKSTDLTRLLLLPTLALVLVSAAIPASAHDATGHAGGFVSGFSHPILGWDHVIAMVAVGLWGAFLGSRARWILPVTFPLIMTAGATIGIIGLPLPAVETGIALSGVVLGLLIAFAVKAPLWIATVIVGIFALFHGHAHGTELPSAANPLAYAVGFVLATGLLHLAGIGFGMLTTSRPGRIAIRAMGLAIAAVGGAFLTGLA
ncbi:HupE/UreJ family protein [Pseudooceanicola algae]|uniref:Uncharacterized protein n=1 Tax=Pseudooceanicola algae TaxID=1537215 RepID=A0A418SFU9_9RHOB|nr:HupE/UreJ family protein [Pseudooceanicola algae]QPM91557.1 hypothetical protein PSAL_028110 [Pseudooceanicola algae]